MQKEIIAAIEKALNENLNHTYIGYEINLQEIAAEIAAAIAPQISKLQDACKEVVKGYEGDGMENMYPRDEVFYRVCKEALE